jgi:segregation and condensation protein B
MSFLQRHIEALVFCAAEPIGVEELADCLSEMFDAQIPIEDIEEALHQLTHRYQDKSYAFGLEKLAGGYQFLTKPSYQSSVGLLLKQKAKKKLSTSALETLSIIAYKQPVSKVEIEQIRGVNCDYAVHRLLERELIEIRGKADTVGKPILYGTTSRFLAYFGINSLTELPTLKDFTEEETQTLSGE